MKGKVRHLQMVPGALICHTEQMIKHLTAIERKRSGRFGKAMKKCREDELSSR